MAFLAFDYELLKGAKEFEVLHYAAGPNWMNKQINKPARGGDAEAHHSVSHFGMHCDEEELSRWKNFFADRGIGIAQEVHTTSHTNPHIVGKRWYHYCIFNTRPILGVDIKFIIRQEAPPL